MPASASPVLPASVPRQIIAATSGMAVHHRERRVLLPQMQKYPDQREMLDHIGEVSRVIAVPIIHASNCPPSRFLAVARKSERNFCNLQQLCPRKEGTLFPAHAFPFRVGVRSCMRRFAIPVLIVTLSASPVLAADFGAATSRQTGRRTPGRACLMAATACSSWPARRWSASPLRWRPPEMGPRRPIPIRRHRPAAPRLRRHLFQRRDAVRGL